MRLLAAGVAAAAVLLSADAKKTTHKPTAFPTVPTSSFPTSLPSARPTSVAPVSTDAPNKQPTASTGAPAVLPNSTAVPGTAPSELAPTGSNGSSVVPTVTPSAPPVCANFTGETQDLCNVLLPQLEVAFQGVQDDAQGLMDDINQFFLVIMGALVLFMCVPTCNRATMT